MKILSSNQLAELDAFTIKQDNISSIDLMERAARKCFDQIISLTKNKTDFQFHVFCGIGNNGGDGLVISRLLHEADCNVHTYILDFSSKHSADFTANLKRLDVLGTAISFIHEETTIKTIQEQDCVIDAIFGNGLNRAPEGFVKQCVQEINASKAQIIAVDMPSGLFANAPVQDKDSVVQADCVLTFQTPKLGLLLPDNQKFIKEWLCLDIGLNKSYLDTLKTVYHYTTETDIISLYQQKKQWTHKGNNGKALVIAGSFGKVGAAFLTSKACLLAGSGLVTALVPACAYAILQTSLPELMLEVDDETHLKFFKSNFNADVIAIGPGIGTDAETVNGFINFIKRNEKPLVLDADALNILSENNEALFYLPKGSILTPHPKELERLIGAWVNDFEKLEKAQAFAKKHDIILVLKGKYSAILDGEQYYFNATGNPALATAGSGDALTGIVVSLLAQGYSALHASKMAVYIHGLAADIYTETFCPETFTASTIFEYLPLAFKRLFKKE